MALKRTSGVNPALDCIRQSRYNRRVCVPAVDVDKTRFLHRALPIRYIAEHSHLRNEWIFGNQFVWIIEGTPLIRMQHRAQIAKTKQKGKVLFFLFRRLAVRRRMPETSSDRESNSRHESSHENTNLPVWCAGKGRRAEQLPCWPRRCACGEGNEGNGASCPSAGSPAPVATDPDVREQIGGGDDARSRQMEGKMNLRPLQPTDRYLPNYFQLF